MMEELTVAEFKASEKATHVALDKVLEVLMPLDHEQRSRILAAACVFFQCEERDDLHRS